MPERRPVSWLSIIVIYLYTVFSMAAVGLVIPLTADLSGVIGAPIKTVGLTIAMFSVPSALFATVGGGIIDRVGARPAMIVSALICVLSDAAIVSAHSIPVLNLGLLLAGVGFAGISVAAPAMIVTTMEGPLQVKAMSLWSTYGPTGFALGLVLSAPFAGKPMWWGPLALHAVLMIATAACGLLLPAPDLSAVRAPTPFGQRLKDLGAVISDFAVLRLAVAVALPAAISYGTSMVAPSYLAKVHDIGIGASSTAVAAAKAVAMILCGLVMGQILTRKVNTLGLFAGLCAAGVLAQVAIFYPGDSFLGAAGGLVVWLFAYGGAAAVGMSLLKSVIRNPAHSGAASGLIGQLISCASFITPGLYFGMQGWMGFIAVAAVGMTITLVALPIWLMKRRPAPLIAESSPA
jgi:MFS family permease